MGEKQERRGRLVIEDSQVERVDGAGFAIHVGATPQQPLGDGIKPFPCGQVKSRWRMKAADDYEWVRRLDIDIGLSRTVGKMIHGRSRSVVMASAKWHS